MLSVSQSAVSPQNKLYSVAVIHVRSWNNMSKLYLSISGIYQKRGVSLTAIYLEGILMKNLLRNQDEMF